MERESVQHDPCGCIRPRDAFLAAGDDGDPRCPQCGVADREAAYSRIGTFYVCPDCLQRYDAALLDTPTVADRPTVTSVADGGRDGSYLSRGRHWIGAIVLVSLIVVAALTLPAGVVPGQSAPEAPAPIPTESDRSLPQAGADEGTATDPAPGRDRSAADSELAVPTASNYSAPEPGSYETIVVYRNDDVMAHARPGALDNVTAVFADTGVPVTYGVIGEVPPNATVCRYLRQLRSRHPGQFDTALHGYTHANLLENRSDGSRYSRSEFASRPYREQRVRIRRGTRNVTRCTDARPRTFVPPFDTYDNTTVRALDAAGYDTVSGGAWSYDNERALFADGGLTHVSYVPSSARVQVYYDYSETPPSPHSVARINRSFDRAYRNNSLYLFTMHYRYFTDERSLERLRQIIAHQQSHDVAFMTVGQVSRATRQGYLSRTDDGWRLSERPGNASSATPTAEADG